MSGSGPPFKKSDSFLVIFNDPVDILFVEFCSMELFHVFNGYTLI